MIREGLAIAFRALLFFSIIWSNAVISISLAEPDEGYVIEYYDPSRAYNGTTLFTDTHDSNDTRVVQIDMLGETVWEYVLPDDLETSGPGFDAELLTNGNILIVAPRRGIYEITRSGDVVWSNLDVDVSHDADRLENGNTLYVFGDNDTPDEAVVKEVNANGDLIWSWYATNEYKVPPYFPYTNVYRGGWAHVNAATRMTNGNTLISLRNFNLTIEVDTNGTTVWSFDWTNLYAGSFPIGYDPHEPELLPVSNLLVCLQQESPYQVVEIDRSSGAAVWEYARVGLRTTRDSDRLPNGNTLIVGVMTQDAASVIFEVTTNKDIVWQLRLTNTPAGGSPGWFFKAQRVTDFDQDGFQDSMDPDDDNDGMSDTDEDIAGTSRTNRDDVFKIDNIVETTATNGVLVYWSSVTGRIYSVYGQTNLISSWPTNSIYQTSGDGSQKVYTNIYSGARRRFYRLKVKLAP